MAFIVQKTKKINIIDEENEYTISFSADDEYGTVRMSATTGPVPEVIYIPLDCLSHVIEALKEFQLEEWAQDAQKYYESPNF